MKSRFYTAVDTILMGVLLERSILPFSGPVRAILPTRFVGEGNAFASNWLDDELARQIRENVVDLKEPNDDMSDDEDLDRMALMFDFLPDFVPDCPGYPSDEDPDSYV